MKLECFSVTDHPPEIRPGRPERAWMDAFGHRAPYRCLPLTVANSSGWELLCPYGFTAEWNGGSLAQDITITPDPPVTDHHHFVSSHFAGGVVTFHPGYLFRTDPGWAVVASGPPNMPRFGIQPLTGLIETDWLPFPFTMNWMFTDTGRIRFEKGDVFCFMNLVEHGKLDVVKPIVRKIDDHPQLKAEYQAWSTSRHDFNHKLALRDPETMKQAWQRYYFKGGAPPEGGSGATPSQHVNKRRLNAPAMHDE
jgi:hypothetical protein